jgi:hypothetical protein
MDNNEKKKIAQGIRASQRNITKAGVRSIFKTAYLAAHPGGTVKVGDILDSDLKTGNGILILQKLHCLLKYVNQ